MALLPILLASVALAKAPTATWVPLGDGTSICVSDVRDAGKLRKADRSAFEGLLADWQGGADPAGLVERVGTMRTAIDHPALDSAAVAVSVAIGTPDVAAAEQLAEAHVGDPCLAAAAATALLDLGGRDTDLSLIERYVGRAWLAAAHPELARVLATVLLANGEIDRSRAILEEWVARAPDYPELRSLLAEVALASGDSAEAIDELLALHRSGDHRMDGTLLDALYRAGRMGEYLVVAAGAGAPLGGSEEAILAAEDPMQALRGHLGLTEPGQTLDAQLETSQGIITCTLFVDEAPVTVANFVGLAKGTQPWTHPMTGAAGDGSLYENTMFHRVIPDFMVQGGDPVGTGSGGPGYRFWDEVDDQHRFDRPGRLAMANAGPGTNGSQFFVTVAPTPHLDGRHTVFGQCGTDVAERITAVPRDGQDRPLMPVALKRVTFEVRQPE